MDFKKFRESIKSSQSPRWTHRQRHLDAYRRALGAQLYHHIKYSFTDEKSNGYQGDRISLDARRASVQDRLPQELVRDLVGMLFGEAHRPTYVARDDEATSDWLTAFIRDTDFWLTMAQLLWSASVGSGCLVLRVLGDGETDDAGNYTPKGEGSFHAELWPAEECKPVFHRSAPKNLKSVERIYFVGEDALAADGYDVDKLLKEAQHDKRRRPTSGSEAVLMRNADTHWAMRVSLDENAETWYKPVPKWVYERPDFKDWVKDTERSIEHDLEFTPARWVRPMPLTQSLFPDGDCLFDAVIDYQFRIDRTMSQSGRAFDYAGDPQMARIFEASGGANGAFGGDDFEEPIAVGGTASDMIEQTGGDVKFVEAKADAIKIAIETYVKQLRDMARENGAMSRITPEGNARTELSAVAMKMLNFAQTVVADLLRVTLGEDAAIAIFRMAMRMYLKVQVSLPSLDGKKLKPNVNAVIETSWPEYYELHGTEKLADVQATAQAIEAGVLSTESAITYTAGQFDVQDAGDEKKRIEAEQTARSEADTANEITKTQAAGDTQIKVEQAKAEGAVKVAAVRGATSSTRRGNSR